MIRQETVELICFLEGFVAYPYKCPAGVWTIGYGSTYYPNGKKVSPSDPAITEEKALSLMADTLNKDFEPALRAAAHVPVNYFIDGALLSWTYNVGIEAMKGSSLIKKLNASDFEGARQGLLAWDKYTNPSTGKKEVLAGLQRRRNIEMAFWKLDDSRPYTKEEMQQLIRSI